MTQLFDLIGFAAQLKQGAVCLALFGAVSLMQPSLPKVLFGAAITLAVWIAIAQKRLTT
jgi:hypothetical protein